MEKSTSKNLLKTSFFEPKAFVKKILVLLLIISSSQVNAQLLGSYNACPGGGCTVNTQRIYHLVTQPSYATMDSMTFTGLSASGSNAYSFVSWQTGGSLLTTEYVQFIVRPKFSNWGLIIDSIKFDIGRNSSGPTSGIVSHNKSGAFLTDTLRISPISNYSGTSTITFAQNVTWDLNHLALAKGDTLAFRFYGRGSSNGLGGVLAINNIALYGHVYDVQYRSNAASGSWTTSADWQFNSVAAYTTATIAPTGGSYVLIRPNHTISRSSGLTIGSDCNMLTDSGRLIVNGGITINSGDSLINNGQIQLTGNWVNNGTYIGHTDTVELNGGSNQTLSGTSTFNRLTLNGSSASITSGVGNTINVSGVYTHQAGTLTTNGNLVLKATGATNYAQIAGTGSGSISGNLISEFYINGGGLGFRPICSPVNGATLAQFSDDLNLDFGSLSASSANVYYFDESAAPYWNIASSTSASLDNRVYSIYMGGTASWANPLPATVDVTGNYNGTSDYSVNNLSRNGSIADTTGWHFIRNPWPSGFTWDGTSGNVMVGAGAVQGQQVWIYNQSSGSYVTFDNSTPGVIPPFTPFTVQVTANNTNLTFLNSGRTIGTLANYFGKTGLENYIELQVSDMAGNIDKVKWYTSAEATNGYDIYDGNKLMNQKAPNLYFMLEGYKANKEVWNTLPAMEDTVKLHFSAKENGIYTINFNVENMHDAVVVYLEDVLTKQKHNITNGEYAFMHNINNNQDRFRLLFNKTNATATTEIITDATVISSYENNLVISGLTENTDNLEVFDLIGKNVVTKNDIDAANGIYTLKLDNLAPGYYIVKLNNKGATQTAKIFIK